MGLIHRVSEEKYDDDDDDDDNALTGFLRE